MTHSVWEASTTEERFPALAEELKTDVVVIGGGITGVTTAMLLAKSGAEVVLLEADRLGHGTTGHSTGNLYATVDWDLSILEDKWDREIMQAVVHSRQDAVDLIELTTHTYGLRCEFVRVPFCLYAESGSNEENRRVETEYRAAINANLNARLVTHIALPFAIKKALVIEGQAQFHPLNFVRELAAHIVGDQCRIFEHSQVVTIDDEQGLVKTDSGQVRAKHIVLATHTPKGIYAVQTEMTVHQEHAVALRLENHAYPHGIFWSAGEAHSLRSARYRDQQLLVIVGQKHPTGYEAHAEQCVEALDSYARERFPIASRQFAWTAQQYRSADGLPYIGKSPGTTRSYIGTGFGSDGLTYGALAAMVITEDILGRESKWSDLYEPARLAPTKSVKGFAQETARVASNLLNDYFQRYPDQLNDVPQGQGQILDIDGRKLGVYRDKSDRFALVDATCTHMGCRVNWNSLERTWDCPCHGSRFTVQGEIIEGPALNPLERYDAPVK